MEAQPPFRLSAQRKSDYLALTMRCAPILLVLAALAALPAPAAEPLTFAAPTLPTRLTIDERGHAQGPIGETLEKIFAEAKLPVAFRDLPSKRAELDQAVYLTGGAKSAAREKDWLYSRRKYMDVQICLYWQDLDNPVASAKDLNGRSVITILGADPARDLVAEQAPGAKFVEARNPETALLMLENRRAEFLLDTDTDIDAELAAGHRAKLESLSLKVVPIYVMVRKSTPNSAKILARIDAAMASLAKSGPEP